MENPALRKLTENIQDVYNRAFEDATHRVLQQIVNDYHFHVVSRQDMSRQGFINAVTNAIGGDEILYEAFMDRFGFGGK